MFSAQLSFQNHHSVKSAPQSTVDVAQRESSRLFLNFRKKFYRFRESCIKRYLELTNKNYAYAFSYYPDIKTAPNANGSYEVFFKKRKILTSCSYDELPKNIDEVYILGSGPSVTHQNIAALKNKNVIFLNGSITVATQHGIKPFAHIIIDKNFIINRSDLLLSFARTTSEPTPLFLSLPALEAALVFCREIIFKYKIFIICIKEQELMHSQLSPWQLPGKYFAISGDKQTAFSMDLNEGFWDGGTVMGHAVQLCHYLGVRNTYMLGFDIGNAAQPRFYENSKNKQKSSLLRDYETKILPFMTFAAQIFKESSQNIYNCSPVSKLPYEIIAYSKFQ